MRSALASVSLLVVAAIVWLLITGSADPAPAGARVEAAAGAPAPAATVSTSIPAPAAPEPARQLAPLVDAGAPSNVRVVTFGSEEGVAGATVRYMPPNFDWQKLTDAERQQFSSERDSEARLQHLGAETTTGADGGCSVPVGASGTQVTARSGELYAEAYVRADAKEPTVLALRPDRALHALVVDAAGRPAPGIRLQAQRIAGATEPAGRERSGIWLGETDATGHYQQQHFQTLADKNAIQTFELWASSLGASSPTVRIEATEPPAEVVLHLPVAGAVTVHVRDIDGKPIDPALLGDAKVRLNSLDKQPAGAQELNATLNMNQSDTAAIDAGGDARFPCVAFDRWLIVRQGYSVDQLSVAGPTLANPALELTLRETADDVILTGTLLQQDGAAFAERAFMVSYRADGNSGSRSARTDANGRMRCNLSHYAKGLQATLGFATMPSPGAAGMAVELPPRKLQAGVLDLGEVRLQPFGILIAGRLHCDEGVDCKRANFEFERKVGERWNQEFNLYPDWQPDGSFVAHSGIAKGEPMRLIVHEGAYLPVEPIGFRAGDTDVTVSLRAAGSATATFLIDERTPVDRLALRLRRTQPPEQLDWRQQMMQRHADMQLSHKDGHASRSWTGLEPGTYQLTAACQGNGEPFLTIDSIEIGGGPCTDPRLSDIDLRGRLRRLEIRATGADGAPITDANAFVLITSKSDEWNGYSLRSGVATIATATAVDLWVLAKGHRMATAEAVSDSCSIALQAATEAQLAVTIPSPLPDGAKVRLRLLPKLGLSKRAQLTLDNGSGMGLESFLLEQSPVAADGSATVTVRWPGEYSIEGTVGLGDRGGSYFRDFEPRTLTLPAAGTVALRIGKGEFDKALQRMR